MPRYDDNVRGGGGHSPNDRRDRRSLKSPLLDRHRRDSPPQYQSSSSRLGPRDHDRHTGGTGGGGLYHHRDSYSSSRSSYHYSREPTNNGPMPYKILCLSNLNSKFPDSTIRNEIEKEFSRFGEPMVKLVYDRTERIAYLYFHSYEDAREAKRANFRLSILDRPLVIEPIYNSVKKRSASPDYHRSLSLRSHSPGRRITPTHRGVNERYQLSHLRDYHRDVHNPHSKSDNFPTQLSSRPTPGQNAPIVRENKKDKFPNYLHHIPPEDDDKATRTLFVGNLEVNITEPDLKRIFERYGEVDDIDVKRPPPGQGNAYAFIKFVNLDMAHRAKVEMSGQYIGKFQCKIGYGKATPTTRIWVGGLGSWTNLTLLDKEFDRFGAIRKIDYNKGDNFAYIQYDSLDAAQAACQSMRGYPLGGEDKRLRIDYADPTPTSLSPRPGNDNVNNFNFTGSPRNAQNNNNGNNNNQLWSGDNYHPSSPKRKRMQNSDGEGSDRKRSPISGLSSPRPDNGDSAENGSPSFDLSNGKSQIKASINENVTSVAELIRCSAPAWTGGLVIKSSAFASKACFCCGDFLLVNELMKSDNSSSSNVVLRLTQRLRMDPERLDDVSQRISAPDSANKYCMMVVSQATINLTFENYTPGSDGVEATALQTRPIRNLVTYLKSKEAAGVVLLTENPCVSTDELNDAKGVLYIFPPHKFSVDLLRKVAPNLSEDSTEKEDFLVFVLFRGPH